MRQAVTVLMSATATLQSTGENDVARILYTGDIGEMDAELVTASPQGTSPNNIVWTPEKGGC